MDHVFGSIVNVFGTKPQKFEFVTPSMICVCLCNMQTFMNRVYRFLTSVYIDGDKLYGMVNSITRIPETRN
jgi:hypothetical protein